eukprot:10948586-Lingulodinium_polyedra.AAC.1
MAKSRLAARCSNLFADRAASRRTANLNGRARWIAWRPDFATMGLLPTEAGPCLRASPNLRECLSS